MKSTLFLALAFSSLFTLLAFTNTNTAVKFVQSDWEGSKTQAISEKKLYFVDFDASYCATCRNMDESTYMDQQLADFMGKNVVALRVDVQDFDGVMWSQQYEVDALPTMLIFDNEGKLVKRLVGYRSAAELIEEFKAAQLISETTTAVKPQPIAPDEPMKRPEESPKPKTNAFKSGGFKSADMSETTQASGLGLYEVIVNKQASKGYGVQIGVFSSYKKVLDQADKFNRKYSKKTLIHIDTHNGSTVYKLLLGVFESRSDASFFRNDLRKDNTDGLIKDLSVMG
jgi:thioredoxin-related protein